MNFKMYGYPLLVLPPLFALTALVYSMVGFGGGSTYLALLALFGASYVLIPTTGLICNIVVVTGGTYLFSKARHLDLKNVLPFLFSSIPFAFIGGRLPVSKSVFFILLATSLLFAAFRLYINEEKFQRVRDLSWRQAWVIGLPVGALLGFLSGLTGIGGGIFLSPLLYFLGWGNGRAVAAAASLFILCNSLSGLLGQLLKNSFAIDWHLILPLALAAGLGGQIGSRLGAKHLKLLILQRLTATLILFVSLRIFWQMVFG